MAAPVVIPVVVYVNNNGGSDSPWWMFLTVAVAALVTLWMLFCTFPAWDDTHSVWGGKQGSFWKTYAKHVFTAKWLRKF